MIESISIRNLGVISETRIELAPGMTAVTGETGAGKTMLLTGLSLLMGGKADTGLVRHGSARADVDGDWRVSGVLAERVSARLDEAGAEVEFESDQVHFTMSRTVAGEGRSRAFAGGRSVPSAVLSEVCADLIAVHGQSDQWRLKSAAKQRELLDTFIGQPIASASADYRAAFAEWRSARERLQTLIDTRLARVEEAQRITIDLEEIDSVAPQPGEDVELDRLAGVLAHSGELLLDVEQARALLIGTDAVSGDADAVSTVYSVIRLLERATALDPLLTDLLDRMREVASSLGEVGVDLARYASDVDADPARQAWVEQRRAALSALKRRFGSSVDEVLAWAEKSRALVAEVELDDDTIAALEVRLIDLEGNLRKACVSLSTLRREGAAALGERVSTELRDLALPDAVLSIAVEFSDTIESWGEHGGDRVEFLLTAHAGGPARPLATTASGGELSRIMLGIEVVLAGTDPVPTFVFDEVDAGIGGRAAVEVGRKLAMLGRTSQVLVVTHLPQVAAFADTHLVVTKGADGIVTTSNVSAVAGDARVTELVRMLSGLQESASGAAHAQELLDLAEYSRASWK